MWYSLLADVIVAIHLAYVSYVVFGQLYIFIGLPLRWKSVRNPWFRWTHLAMITIVAIESIFQVECPLTTWEDQLRKKASHQNAFFVAQVVGTSTQPLQGVMVAANENVATPSFVGRLMHDLMFYDVDFEDPRFLISYVAFALLTIATQVFAPPRRFQWRKSKPQETPALVETPANPN